jgi:pimeloyl-ACP methyl ester carboxylesterase
MLNVTMTFSTAACAQDASKKVTRKNFVAAASGPTDAARVVELVIPLENGRTISRHALLEACNRQLGSAFDLRIVPEHKRELTATQLRNLRLLSIASSLKVSEQVPVKVSLKKDCLTLTFPSPESLEFRQRRRQILEGTLTLLGIPDIDPWTGKGLHRPPEFDPTAQTVLLIHGLDSSADAFLAFQRAFERRGFQVLTFDYPNDGPIEESGIRLHADLGQLAQDFTGFQLSIVAHSMGGLVSRYALEAIEPQVNCVSDLFTLGTPHCGSNLSGGHFFVECLELATRQERKISNFYQDGLGEGANDLRPQSPFLKSLNQRSRRTTIRYHAGVGSKSWTTKDDLVLFQTQLPIVLNAARIPLIIQSELLGRLEADELWDGKGDGAVSITSAMLEGATTQRLFDLNHLQLLQAPLDQPETSVVVQWILDTLHVK